MPKCPTKVHVRYVESTSPNDVPFWQSMQGDTHGDACCYHSWDGKVPSFGKWLGHAVREIIKDAYFKTNWRVQQIVQQLHGKNCCNQYSPERLSTMIPNFIFNVPRKQHGTVMMTHSYCSVTHTKHQKSCALCSALCNGFATLGTR